MIGDDLEIVRVEALALVEGELDGSSHPRGHALHLSPDPLGVVGAPFVPLWDVVHNFKYVTSLPQSRLKKEPNKTKYTQYLLYGTP